MNSVKSPKLSDEQVIMFFRKLKNELNCASMRKTIAQVRTILSKIKGSYSTREITELINKTPPLLHFVLMGNSRYDDDKKPIHHLDELVDTLYYEDEQNIGNRLFHSEIETLGTVIIILKRIQNLFTYAGMKIFPTTLSNELQRAVL
ncbi:MAG TPA: hypothetical protein VFU05_11250 [Cyclobacteriaceae bacterium]|nr:hypothetical protein [Cyclobacteriaceae bacterium]